MTEIISQGYFMVNIQAYFMEKVKKILSYQNNA